MSMRAMREHTKTFIWIMAIAFIVSTFVLWGMQYSPSMQNAGGNGPTDDTIGEVNGVKIKYDEFLRIYQRTVTQREQQNPERELTPQELKAARDQAWKDMTDRILFDQQVKELNIKVTDAEILEEITKNPPEFLKSNFLDDSGNFDYDSYMGALKQADDQAWLELESTMRDYLPRRKLQDQIQATARVTDLEVRQDFIDNNEKVKIDYLFIDVNTIDKTDLTATDDEVQTYYNENKENYKELEKRIVDYIFFEVKFSDEDKAELEAKKAEIVKKLEEGTDFAELAKEYSQDPGSAVKGGDLDFFGRGQMVKPFEETAFGLADGERSDWIKSQFGWHLIFRHASREQKNDRSGEMEQQVHASHILLKEEPSAVTISNIAEKAYDFANELDETGSNFDSLVKKYGVEIKTSPSFLQQGGFIQGIGRLPEAVDFAFNNEIGAVSTVFEVPGNKGYAIIKVKEIEPEQYKPLEEVKPQITNVLVRDKQLQKAADMARELYEQINAGSTLDAIAAADTAYTVEQTELFTRKSFVKNIGRDNEVTQAAFVLPLNEVSEPLETNKGYYLIRVVEHQDADMEQFEKERSTIVNRLLQQKKNQAFANWYQSIRDNAEINDYRDQFFN